jgi:tungstate transport system ATP-binding protein
VTELVYKLEGVTKSYGGREVCHVDRLEVRRGAILGVMGPSGAGKSTLLRMLNFLEPPTSGAITFNGRAIANGAAIPLEERRKVTTVFQDPVMLNATVAGNVAYGLRLRQRKDVQERVLGMLEMVGLQHMAKARATTLSRGEAQRVALARALVIEPEVLLLDEPTANLDPYNVALIEGLVTRVNRERGTTVVLVTHNVFQTRRVAQEVALIVEGRIVEVGATVEVFSSPKDPRTAAFIRGEMVY